jgi:hypothetical protein
VYDVSGPARIDPTDDAEAYDYYDDYYDDYNDYYDSASRSQGPPPGRVDGNYGVQSSTQASNSAQGSSSQPVEGGYASERDAYRAAFLGATSGRDEPGGGYPADDVGHDEVNDRGSREDDDALWL